MPSNVSRRTLALAAGATLAMVSSLAPPPAAAAGLADLIPNLLGTGIQLTNNSHQAHFFDTSQAQRATGLALDESLVSALNTFPIASSAGGFTYEFDSTLGTFTRSTESFGPVFTERAQTIGRGKFNFGVNYLSSSYDELDGLDLESGELELQLTHLDLDPLESDPDHPPTPFFEGDVISVNTELEVETNTTVFYGNYGFTDNFDVSVAIPYVQVDLAARESLQIRRLSTAAIPAIHIFANGTDRDSFSASGSASGIGDILTRAKLRFLASDRGGMAAALDVRFPTGDEEELLGSGFFQTRLSFIGSASFGRAGLHGNLGYSVASGSSDVIDDLPDELSYNAAFDFAVHPRFTIVTELVGRTLYDTTRAAVSQRTFHFTAGSGGPASQVDLPQVSFEKDDLQLLLGSVGVKFNPTGNLLITANALWSLSDDGLQDTGVIGVAGLEYSF